MKKVLIVAYYFPPSGGPGVQRVLKYTRYLREFGWEPIILTVKNGNFPAIDESLIKEIPEGVNVVRTEIFEPYDLYRKLTGKSKNTAIDVNTLRKDGAKISFTERISEFIRATFFIPDARIGWHKAAVDAGLKLIKNEGISAIYSSSPPYTCSVIARTLKRKSGLPWIAGFRDPWTGFLTTPKRWWLPAKIDSKLEKAVFEESDAIEVAWLGIMKDAITKYPELNKDKFHHLPNGFDSNDYPNVNESERTDFRFTITYAGSMYGRRNPAAFFKALEKLHYRKEIDITKIRLRFIGRFGDEVLEMFKSTDIRNCIEVIGYMQHNELTKQLLLSDALLLIVDESDDSNEIVPGKVYEYIGSGKGVLAIAPEKSAIADLIKETISGYVAHQSNLDGIADSFLIFYNAHQNGGSIINPKMEIINKYERRTTTGILADLLNRVTKK